MDELAFSQESAIEAFRSELDEALDELIALMTSEEYAFE